MDAWAWHAACAEHAGWLRRILSSRLGEAHAVDEAMQEIALAAARQTAAPNAPSAWLYRVAVRIALARRRKLGRERRLVARVAAEPPKAGAAEPLTWLLAEERAANVRTALARLAPRPRELLLLKYAEHWTAAEIAARLGLRPEAVDARLHRARAALRRELLALGEGHDT